MYDSTITTLTSDHGYKLGNKGSGPSARCTRRTCTERSRQDGGDSGYGRDECETKGGGDGAGGSEGDGDDDSGGGEEGGPLTPDSERGAGRKGGERKPTALPPAAGDTMSR